MTINLRQEQEELLQKAIDSGLAHSIEDALDQALEMLRDRLRKSVPDASAAAAARRLATFGRRHGLSLGGSTIKDLLHERRP